MSKRAAIFLDKDGTLVPNVPYNIAPERILLAPGAEVGLPLLSAAGYRLVVISNQSGIARGYFDEQALMAVERRIRELLENIGVPLDGFYYCPHHPTGTVAKYSLECDCRKPKPGLLLWAAAELHLDLAASWMFGDILDDVEAGHRAGCKSLLILNGGETEWDLANERMPDVVAVDLAQAASRVADRSAGPTSPPAPTIQVEVNTA
jgi:D-glycero-D-manno-heptose 1,7-bisphosphate phosphatase